MDILYNLKYAKSAAGRDAWKQSYYLWEKRYESFLSARKADGQFYRPRLRSARLIIRRALPYLFTFLDHPGSPNTTNLVEGWVNGAMAEALRFHRGLRVHEKRALATIILSNLKRRHPPGMTAPAPSIIQKNISAQEKEVNERVLERLRKARERKKILTFIKRYSR